MGRWIKVGNGAAISASKKMLKQNGWKFGQEVEVIVVKKDKKAALKRLFGMYPSMAPFVREKDREF
ncbi:MAG: hypothetical protein ABIG96_00715 [Candidatus Micrarchaeota archaeon]